MRGAIPQTCEAFIAAVTSEEKARRSGGDRGLRKPAARDRGAAIRDRADHSDEGSDARADFRADRRRRRFAPPQALTLRRPGAGDRGSWPPEIRWCAAGSFEGCSSCAGRGRRPILIVNCNAPSRGPSTGTRRSGIACCRCEQAPSVLPNRLNSPLTVLHERQNNHRCSGVDCHNRWPIRKID